ncbi:hypothetical protein ABZP36_010578 [Zizania latifolia]
MRKREQRVAPSPPPSPFAAAQTSIQKEEEGAGVRKKKRKRREHKEETSSSPLKPRLLLPAAGRGETSCSSRRMGPWPRRSRLSQGRRCGMADLILLNSKFTTATFARTFCSLHARGIEPAVLYPGDAPQEVTLTVAAWLWLHMSKEPMLAVSNIMLSVGLEIHSLPLVYKWLARTTKRLLKEVGDFQERYHDQVKKIVELEVDNILGFHSNTPVVIGAQMRYEVTSDLLYKVK